MNLLKFGGFRLFIAILVSVAMFGAGYFFDAARQAKDRFGLWSGAGHRLYLGSSGLFYWAQLSSAVGGRYVLTRDGQIEFEVFQTNYPYRFRVGTQRLGQQLILRPSNGPEIVLRQQPSEAVPAVKRDLVGTWLYPRNSQHNDLMDLRSDGYYTYCGWPANLEGASGGRRALYEFGLWDESSGKIGFRHGSRKRKEVPYQIKQEKPQKLVLDRAGTAWEFFRIRHRSTIKVAIGDKAFTPTQVPGAGAKTPDRVSDSPSPAATP